MNPIYPSSKKDDTPCISADGLSLYFSSNRPGGSGSYDIWVTTRETMHDPWGEPVNLGPTVNSPVWDISPSVTASGELYFGSTRPGGYGAIDIWMTTRTNTSEPWDQPVNLGSILNGSSEDVGKISFDGLSMIINSTRPGGQGGQDLWISMRPTLSGTWSKPTNLGPGINSSSWDWEAMLSADNRYIFFTSEVSVLGRDDLWFTSRATVNDPWSAPVNLGEPVNSSSHDDFPCISFGGSMLYFTSNRPGGSGATDLYQAAIEPVVDFTGDDKVDIEDLLLLIEDWGTNNCLCDIGPTPLGDGVVDATDLEVLMRHWGQDDRIIAHWKLDETGGDIAYDSVGESHAAVIGDPVWQRESGQIDGALHFDGLDDYLAAPFILDPAKQPFGVLAWVKGGGPGQAIISQEMAIPTFDSVWLGTDPIDGRLVTSHMYPMVSQLESNVVITDNQWHHVGLVWDGTHRHLYVDDEEVAVDEEPFKHLASSGGLHIGADSHLHPAAFWSGLIDDVRIYDRVVVP